MGAGTNTSDKPAVKKWIQKAVPDKNAGKLHDMLGVPEGQTIPLSTLQDAAKKPGLIGQRARFALNVRGLNKK